MNFFDHKDLGNHLLQLCPKVVKHPVYIYIYLYLFIYTLHLLFARALHAIHESEPTIIVQSASKIILIAMFSFYIL